jgi:hypothetical protein
MASFSQHIQEFEQFGTYTYKFDGSGNLIFNSSSSDFSQVYVAFPLQNVAVNVGRVNSMYTSEFEEFVPLTGSSVPVGDALGLQQQVDLLQQENTTLKTQLDGVIAISGADQLATKQVILELRKSLGQGRVDGDFSETFPYTPIRKASV